jgi:hypothetical protein
MESVMTDTIESIETEQQYVDYWGTDEEIKHFLPDGKQYFVLKIMNEGAKSQFQKMTNQDLIVGRDNTATVKMNPAKERHELIKASVTGWNLMQKDKKDGNFYPAPFSIRSLDAWLEVAPPKIVEDLEYAIRMANPWMQSEMTVEEVDKEIDRLTELRASLREREQGEAGSTNK